MAMPRKTADGRCDRDDVRDVPLLWELIREVVVGEWGDGVWLSVSVSLLKSSMGVLGERLAGHVRLVGLVDCSA